MNLIADRIQKAAAARRYRPGYGPPESVRKMAAWTFNPPEAKLPSAEPDQPVEVGSLAEGNTFQIVGGSHGIVKAPARNGFVLINDGGVDRYVVASTAVIRSAPEPGSA